MMPLHEIQAMSEDLIQVYTAIEDDLLVNVAKRFSALDEVTPNTVAAWQTDKLQQLGALRKENIRTIKKYSGKTMSEIEHIITNAGYQTLNFDEQIYKAAYSEGLLVGMPVAVRVSPVIQQIAKGAIDNTRSYFNLINTTALQSAQEGFLSIINQTYLETSLGITDYTTSIRKAVRNLADQGITGADYISAAGRRTRNQIDVAVRRAIVTSTSQTAGTMQIQRASEWDSNLVEVTSHAGARPSHAVWQGRIYSIKGSTPQYPNLAASTGYGTVTGLKGANCAHEFYPFFEGLSVQRYKPYDLEENEKIYEQSQRQRTLERDIRAQKRRILAADGIGDSAGKQAAQLRLKAKESELKQFIKDTGRTQRTNRQQIMGFGHSQASQAVWAQRKATLPKTAKADNATLQSTLGDPRITGVIPQKAIIENVRVIAGSNTSTELRNAGILSEAYGGSALQWQKKGGIIETNNYRYDVHWNELNGKQYDTKLKGVKPK